MNKLYYTKRAPVFIVPVFALVPLVGGALRGAMDALVFAEAALYCVLSIGLVLFARRKVARIAGGKLELLSGIGLAEENVVDLTSVTAVERPRPWFMTIRYGEGKAVSLESDKAVLNELAKDLSIFIGKKAEGAARS